MVESKIILKTILTAVTISCFILLTGNLVFSSDEIVVNINRWAVVKVCGGPVGFRPRLIYSGEKCAVDLPLFNDYIPLSPGEKYIIKVLGDDDIVIECLGTKGIKIKKD